MCSLVDCLTSVDILARLNRALMTSETVFVSIWLQISFTYRVHQISLLSLLVFLFITAPLSRLAQRIEQCANKKITKQRWPWVGSTHGLGWVGLGWVSFFMECDGLGWVGFKHQNVKIAA